jgi:signal transduction histidine kinase
MRGLLGNLLDTARLDTGSVTPQLQDVDPVVLVDDLAREFEPVAEDKGLGFGVGISLPEGLRIRTDPVITGRILRNFLSNAVRYTAAGSVTLSATPAELDGRPAVRFTVADTGPGIDPADQERIFAEFTQIDDARRDRSAGVGLGLSIARRMAQILEHDLSLDSRPGEGARFALTVPLAPAARRPLRSSEKPIPADD